MPSDADVIRALADLGVDDPSARALSLLPLVQVAWADGEIRAWERRLIEALASERFAIGEEGYRMLANRLRHPPTKTYLQRGREALRMVALRDQDGMDEALLGDVLQRSREVARAEGGLFGIGAIRGSEAEAPAEIAEALQVACTPLDTAAQGALSPEFGNNNRVTITFSTSTFDVGPLGGVITIEGNADRLPVRREGLRVGSDERADIRVECDPSVAGMHAHILEMNRKFYVRDLDSEHGTWVNGERVAERRLLGGETIRVGREVLMNFRLLRRIPKQMV